MVRRGTLNPPGTHRGPRRDRGPSTPPAPRPSLYMVRENSLSVSAECVQCLVESIVFAIQYSALLWIKNLENVKQS